MYEDRLAGCLYCVSLPSGWYARTKQRINMNRMSQSMFWPKTLTWMFLRTFRFHHPFSEATSLRIGQEEKGDTLLRETTSLGNAEDEWTWASPAEEERALSYRPSPVDHPAHPTPPKQTLHSTEETERTKHTRRFFISKPRGCGKNTVCSWQKAPALFGRKGPKVTGGGGEMPPQPPQPQVRNNILKFLKSFLGILRILQIVFGAGLWVTIAANKYEGSIHFVLFVAVLFWLLTLALFFLTLLDKQDLVPLLGGDRWMATNLAHDVAATVLYVPAIGIMFYKTERNSYCNLELYKHTCLYKVYLTAAVFACLCCLAYLLSVMYGACRKCRREQTVI